MRAAGDPQRPAVRQPGRRVARRAARSSSRASAGGGDAGADRTSTMRRDVIDAGGRVVLPGLIDAHVHVVATSHDLVGLALQPPSLVTAQSSQVLQGMLQRGFTTVRDAAGADFGLQEAVARGLFAGPAPVHRRPADLADRRPRRHAAARACAARDVLRLRRPGPDRRHCRRRRRGAARGARAGAPRRQPDQDHGRRRRVAARPTRSTARSSRSTNCAPPARRPRPPTCTRWRMPTRRAPSRARCRPACARSSTAT